jgi:hypothetical protein
MVTTRPRVDAGRKTPTTIINPERVEQFRAVGFNPFWATGFFTAHQ